MSVALQEYTQGVKEVKHLLRVLPRKVHGISTDPDVDRAVVRACIVLLTSHLEGYLKSVNEEAVAYINGLAVTGDRLPRSLRLKHSSDVIDVLAGTQWDRRADGLTAFIAGDAPLWNNGTVRLEAGRLMVGFKTPKPKAIVTYFERWGTDDIFSAITRSPARRSHYWLRIQSLADKRNNIAHGDASETATPKDVRQYHDAVGSLVARLDNKLSLIIANCFGCTKPW